MNGVGTDLEWDGHDLCDGICLQKLIGVINTKIISQGSRYSERDSNRSLTNIYIYISLERYHCLSQLCDI